MRSYFKVVMETRYGGYGGPYKQKTERQVDTLAEADLVHSLVAGSKEGRHSIHMPCIDIDHKCELIPSSTPGHFHLYINRVVPWRKYRKMLKAMVKAGVVEKKYYKDSKYRHATSCRVPAALVSAPGKPVQPPDEIVEAQNALMEIERDLSQWTESPKPKVPEPEPSEPDYYVA